MIDARKWDVQTPILKKKNKKKAPKIANRQTHVQFGGVKSVESIRPESEMASSATSTPPYPSAARIADSPCYPQYTASLKCKPHLLLSSFFLCSLFSVSFL